MVYHILLSYTYALVSTANNMTNVAGKGVCGRLEDRVLCQRALDKYEFPLRHAGCGPF